MGAAPRKGAGAQGIAAARQARAVESALPPEPAVRRAVFGLWIILAALVVARVALVFVHSMEAWGLNVPRFLAPWAAWPPLALAALALVPFFARAALPTLDRAGEFLARGGVAAVCVAGFAAAMLVLLLPDRAWYVGDFLLRQGAIEEQIGAARVFPQALPFDALLHNQLPTLFGRAFGFDANSSGRLLGAFDAAVLAWGAIALVRALELEGALAVAGITVAFFGGYLAVFTGYSKAVVELCALTVATGACMVRVLRSGRGILPLGIVLAVAFALHRSAVGLLPAALVTWILWLRSSAAREQSRDPRAFAGIALPLLILVSSLPRAMRTFRDVDLAVHLNPVEVSAHGGVLHAAFAGPHVVDLANVLLMLVPLLPLVPVLLLTLGRRPDRGRELVVLGLVALPLVGVLPFIHPKQGMFRDWDDFVAPGAALAVLVVWLMAATLREARAARWISTPIAVCTTLFTLQWLIHHADAERAMTRIRAFLDEAPPRTATERVAALDYLGIRHLRLRDYTASAAAFRAASDLVPNPRFMMEWGLAAAEGGDYHSALESYERLIARTPDDPIGWRGYTAMMARLNDRAGARRGANKLLERVPGDPDALNLLGQLDKLEAAERDSAAHHDINGASDPSQHPR